MNKKIIITAFVVLVLTVTLTACKNNDAEGSTTASSTDKVLDTAVVTGENGGTTNVEIFEDKNGDVYITNVNGEKVPFTTDAAGYGDDIGYLVTSKPASAGTSTSAGTETSTAGETVSGSHIVIGDENQTKQDVISYDELKNPQKYA